MKKIIAQMLVLTALTVPAMAQDAPLEAVLKLELNALQQAEAGCRITFLAVNKLGSALDKAAFEIALFDQGGGIDQLVTLDFNALAQGKTKVLQFELPALECTDVGRILINDASACTGGDIVPSDCLDRLTTSSKVDVVFGT